MKPFILLAAGLFLLLPTTSYAGWFDNARSQQEFRQDIRSTDILDRPYRRGHFYGNAVRRRHR
jgi:hypothetical protein